MARFCRRTAMAATFTALSAVPWLLPMARAAESHGGHHDQHSHKHDQHDHGHGHHNHEPVRHHHEHGHGNDHRGHDEAAEHHRGHHDEHHDHRSGKGHDDHGHSDHNDHDDDHGHGHKHGHDNRKHRSEHDGGDQNIWVSAYLSALSMSAISFVGVVFIAFLGVPKIEAALEYIALAFAGSVLVGDALLHLLPHALEGADHDAMTNVGVAAFVGSLSILVIPEVIGHDHSHGHAHGQEHSHENQVKAYGVANLVVEMVHNFVDGISIGLSWMAGAPAGISATMAVAVHELPQELGDFVVLRAAGFSTGRLLLYNFMASLTCVAGVGLAHYIGQEATVPLQRLLMAFTAGSFLTLALNMIFPQVSESIEKQKSKTAKISAKLACIAMAILAVVVLIQVGKLESGHDHGHDDGHGHGHSGHGHGHGHAHSHQHRDEI